MEYADIRPHLKKLLDGPADLDPKLKEKLANAAAWLDKLDKAEADLDNPKQKEKLTDTAAWLDNLGKDQYEELTTAWLNIADGLSVYTVRRDDNTMYDQMKKMDAIASIEPVVEFCVAQLDGKLYGNRKLAHELIQLFFKASSFHSLNGNHVKAFEWHNKNFTYITRESLEKTLNGTRFHNLLGGDIARLFQSGLLQDCPSAAREHFEIALETHINDLNNNLDESGDMRHIQMCLIHCIIEEVTDKLIKGKLSFSDKSILLSMLTPANNLIKELAPKVVNDGYKHAGVLQNKANMHMLAGDFQGAYELSLQAVESMRKEGPKASGQLSKLLGELARIHTMLAAQFYATCAAYKLRSYETATKELQQITGHPYVELCKKIRIDAERLSVADATKLFIKPSKDYTGTTVAIDPELAKLELQNLDQQLRPGVIVDVINLARVHMMLAARCYAEAAAITGPEKMYAEVAKRELKHILSNPYVQLCKEKLGYLIKDANLLEKLFEEPYEEPQWWTRLTMFFSGGPAKQPTVDFSNIVNLNKAETRIERRVLQRML